MIQDIITTILDVIVPLSLPVIAGILLRKYRQIEIGSLLTLVLYYLTPVLIFDTLMKAKITYENVYLSLAYSLLNLALLWGVAVGVGRLFNMPSRDVAGLTLVSSFTNNVNYGIPLVLLAFGQFGLDQASVYIILQIIIMNTFGIYFAARSHFNFKNAVKSVFSLPAIYATILAVLFRGLHIPLPGGLDTGISMIADAYSPIVLAILGMQMVRVGMRRNGEKTEAAFWTGMAIRMFAAPLLSLFSLVILGIDGVLFSALFVLSCMPVAMNAGILAEKFNASPKLVTKCILWTTVLSFIYLPLIIVFVT